jgi:hypothetical protein
MDNLKVKAQQERSKINMHEGREVHIAQDRRQPEMRVGTAQLSVSGGRRKAQRVSNVRLEGLCFS